MSSSRLHVWDETVHLGTNPPSDRGDYQRCFFVPTVVLRRSLGTRFVPQLHASPHLPTTELG